jgi:hypothetical protein
VDRPLELAFAVGDADAAVVVDLEVETAFVVVVDGCVELVVECVVAVQDVLLLLLLLLLLLELEAWTTNLSPRAV